MNSSQFSAILGSDLSPELSASKGLATERNCHFNPPATLEHRARSLTFKSSIRLGINIGATVFFFSFNVFLTFLPRPSLRSACGQRCAPHRRHVLQLLGLLFYSRLFSFSSQILLVTDASDEFIEFQLSTTPTDTRRRPPRHRSLILFAVFGFPHASQCSLCG